jgi:hypothetical protein
VGRQREAGDGRWDEKKELIRKRELKKCGTTDIQNST